MNEFVIALGGAIVGAAAALAGQWFVTPQIERRVRAERRWEEDALALVRLVNEDLPRAARSLRSALQFLSMIETDLAENPDAPNRELILQLKQRVKDEASEARQLWRYESGERLSVLLERLDLGRLVVAARLEFAAISLPDPLAGIGDTSDAGMEFGWKAVEDARKAFAVEIQSLTQALIRKPA